MVEIDILEELSFFCDLTIEELALIAPLCTLIEGQAGDFIIQEGKLVPNLYILLSGKATILKNRGDGKQVPLASVGKDELIGEVSFFKMALASATVETSSVFKALVLDQRKLHMVLSRNPKLGCKLYKKIARILSERLKNRTEQFVQHLPDS
ncbi:MAG TPA: cyclic nucleotide-binding domain-containing protein [Nitrospirales bacterium]|jgi:CRP-like cAMP-binding protein|nr:cyclic nucleotide-binding domain-containing protein [Nitrospirales bacterium]